MADLDSTDLATRSNTVPAWARERAEMLQGLYIHMTMFAVINSGLALINWMTRGEGGAWWVIWPLLGWGIGLAVHMMATMLPMFSPRWVDRRAEQIARGGHRHGTP
jgi:hypothetical protein